MSGFLPCLLLLTSLLSPYTPAVTLSIHDTDRALRIPLPLALLAGQKEGYFSKT